ncbi:MAG: ribokinase [Roseibacillus sp.]|nr:ribokinase [Roseibacillus sp.]
MGQAGSFFEEVVKEAPIISVVGSLNVDLTFRVPRFPGPGETLMASQALTAFGGKGANQAVAAARAGARVRMIGCLGNDEPGKRYRDYLAGESIDHAGVLAGAGPTGTAFITVDGEGENTIVVHPGANHELTEAKMDGLVSHFRDSAVTLLQLECPLDAVVRAAGVAKEAGATLIFNPSPWDPESMERNIPFDILIVNEREEEGLRSGNGMACIQERCEAIIVTRGAQSTRVLTEGRTLEVEPPSVSPVDTVGAGDTFAGVFALAHAEGLGLLDSVRMANTAAALATLKLGAQEAMPSRAEIDDMLSRTTG